MPQLVVQFPDQAMGVPPVRPAGSRFSPLYCAYNGFLLGQFLALGFEQGAGRLYALRRRAVLALLGEVGVRASLPEQRPDLGSDLHIEMLETLVPRLAQRSQLLADHVVLGSLLAHYGLLAARHPLTAGTLMDEIDALVEQHHLPRVEPDRFAAADGDVECVLLASLEYLEEMVAALPAEPQTALVIVPLHGARAQAEPATPALQGAGYRELRAWGGFADPAGALLSAVIEKVGVVWADFSGDDPHALAAEIPDGVRTVVEDVGRRLARVMAPRVDGGL
ncbi:MAG: hypothetical protein ABW221_16925 [Vicinamibacteria bacterium]